MRRPGPPPARRFPRRIGRPAFAGTLETLVARATTTAFTPGDLVIYRVGDSADYAGMIAATDVNLDKYIPSGTFCAVDQAHHGQRDHVHRQREVQGSTAAWLPGWQGQSLALASSTKCAARQFMCDIIADPRLSPGSGPRDRVSAIVLESRATATIA